APAPSAWWVPSAWTMRRRWLPCVRWPNASPPRWRRCRDHPGGAVVSVPDLYEGLGVARDPSGEGIKRTYPRLARELHPDVNDDPEAERRFKEITAAYQTLSDPARRRQYDVFGSTGMSPQDVGSPFGDLGDVFDVFFGGGGFGRRRSSRR